MAETTRRVHSEEVTYLCEETLGNGITRCNFPMEATGEVYPTLPPMYAHQCGNGHTFTFTKRYPYIRYVDTRGRVVG
jgi:hypothetical protein